MNKYLRKTIKILLWIIASVIVLVVLFALSLNLSVVQNFVKNRAIHYISDKTNTVVALESIKIALPKDVVLNKFYIEDKKGDTLLYAKRLAVDISLFKLLRNTIEINNIELESIRANVKRVSPDTSFNFSFLVDAFMSEQKKPKDQVAKDSTSTLKFSIDKFSFKDIGITYRDDVAGNDVKLYFGDLSAKIRNFDLKNQAYTIKTIKLNNANLRYSQQKPLEQLAAHLENSIDSGKVKAGKLPTIKIEDLSFNKVNINFNDETSVTKADVLITDLSFKNLLADLTKSRFTADETGLSNSNILFAFKPSGKAIGKKKQVDTTVTSPLYVALKKLSLKNNNIRFDNLSMKPAAKGLDFNHIDAKRLSLAASDLKYSADSTVIRVNSGSFNEKSGFILNKLAGDVAYTKHAIILNDFILQTPNTSIDSKASVEFNAMDDLTKHPERVKIGLNIKSSKIGLKDIAYFSDAVPANYRNLTIKIDAQANGTMSDLRLPKFHISGLRNTDIQVSGRVKGLPNIKKAFLDLNIKNLSTSKSDVLAILPAKVIPSNITLPNTIRANGQFKGSMSNFDTRLNIASDMGNARVVASLNGPTGREKYDATINLVNFNAGRLLKQQPKLGKVTMNLHAKGTGLDFKKTNAVVSANVISADYNNYVYKNILLNGKYNLQKLILDGSSKDEPIDFTLKATADLSGKYPTVTAKIDLKQIDLQKLNFSTTELKFTGLIKADIKTADIDHLNGHIMASGFQVVKDGKRFNLDTVEVNATSNANEDTFKLRSEFAQVRLNGKYQLSKVGAAFVNQLNKYYAFGTVTPIPDQRIAFKVNLYNPKMLKDFVPQLKNLKPANITGLLDTRNDTLRIAGNFPQVIYGDYTVDSAQLNVNNAGNKLNYALNVRRVQSPSIQLFATEVKGAAADNKLDLNIFLRDNQRKDRYVIAGIFSSLNKNYRFSFLPDKLLLNYQRWSVDPNNYIQFGKSGILAHQFNLNQGGQSLSINSVGTQPNAPLDVSLKNFKLETVTSFAQADSTLLGGTLDGVVHVRDLSKEPKFEGDLSIAQLRYKKDLLGDVRLTVNNNTKNAFEVNAAVTGVHNLRVNGFYYTAPTSALDLNLIIDKLDLKAVESLSGGQIRQGTGTLNGRFTVKGTLDAPKILGDLNFDQAGFNIKYVNSYFRIPNEQINFTNEGIRFNSFTMIDSLNKKAVVDGMVYTNDYKNYRFGLTLKANDFRALNSTEKDNELIYGTVYITTNLQVTGDMNQPVVNGNVTINDKTKFFFALPADDPAVIEQSGIVQFIDEDAPPFNGKKALNVDSLTRSPLKGLNLSVNIDIDKAAELNVVVDPANGDALRVKSVGSLNATVDPSGKTSLTGRYQLSDGSYNLSVGGLARKEFKIQSGSSIIWTGEPTTAQIDITALYEINAAAIDLVADQIESMSASLRNTYKQKLPFQVYLHLTGELLKPTIAFRLDLPENERGGTIGYAAYTRLQQINQDENELNKQVFALLALNRFVSANPFQSLAGGTNVSSLARQSVSKLLTEQLNNLASDLFKGIDINLGVNSTEDYSSGSLENRTDLEVGLSKKLLNDRLTISVGSNFGIEGNRPANKNSSNIAGNINVEYLLSADGRYRLRFYRRNQTEAVVEGQIIETGVGFALVVDYNKFKEIFKGNSRKARINNELEAVEKVPINGKKSKNK